MSEELNHIIILVAIFLKLPLTVICTSTETQVSHALLTHKVPKEIEDERN